MTTIVYEGATHTLYTDSMVTSKVAGVVSRTDLTYKVEDLSRLKIVTSRGDRLVAFAFSGAVSMFQRISKFILGNLHDWHDGHQRLADVGASLNDFSGSSVLLVTSKRLYCFRFSGGRIDLEEVGLNENVTFGSGGAFAKAAMEVYGANGFDAIAAAAMCDPNTGCLVHSYRIVGNKLVTQDPVLYLDNAQERLNMRKRASKSKDNLVVANLFEHPPENILVNINEDSAFIKKVRAQHQEARSTKRKKKVVKVEQTATASKTGTKKRS